jgi:hypothetical protein
VKGVATTPKAFHIVRGHFLCTYSLRHSCPHVSTAIAAVVVAPMVDVKTINAWTARIIPAVLIAIGVYGAYVVIGQIGGRIPFGSIRPVRADNVLQLSTSSHRNRMASRISSCTLAPPSPSSSSSPYSSSSSHVHTFDSSSPSS